MTKISNIKNRTIVLPKNFIILVYFVIVYAPKREKEGVKLKNLTQIFNLFFN